jgi:hypothetical protein
MLLTGEESSAVQPRGPWRSDAGSLVALDHHHPDIELLQFLGQQFSDLAGMLASDSADSTDPDRGFGSRWPASRTPLIVT